MELCPKCNNPITYNSYFGAYMCDCGYDSRDDSLEKPKPNAFKVEVTEVRKYNITLNKIDIFKVKRYLVNHKDELPSFDFEKNVLWAISQLIEDGKIEIDYEDMVSSYFPDDFVGESSCEKQFFDEVFMSTDFKNNNNKEG